MSGDWVVIYSAPNLSVAEMVKAYLESGGIRAALRSIGLSPFIGVDTVQVLVAPGQEEEARQAVETFLVDAGNGEDGGSGGAR